MLSPSVKQFLSAVLVAAAFAVLGVLQTYVVHLSPELAAIAVPILGGAAHYLNALGHADRVAEVVAAAKAEQ